MGEDGPISIEGNDNWEINGPQSCNRGLNNEFKEYFYKKFFLSFFLFKQKKIVSLYVKIGMNIPDGFIVSA